MGCTLGGRCYQECSFEPIESGCDSLPAIPSNNDLNGKAVMFRTSHSNMKSLPNHFYNGTMHQTHQQTMRQSLSQSMPTSNIKRLSDSVVHSRTRSFLISTKCKSLRDRNLA